MKDKIAVNGYFRPIELTSEMYPLLKSWAGGFTLFTTTQMDPDLLTQNLGH